MKDVVRELAPKTQTLVIFTDPVAECDQLPLPTVRLILDVNRGLHTLCAGGKHARRRWSQ